MIAIVLISAVLGAAAALLVMSVIAERRRLKDPVEPLEQPKDDGGVRG